MKKKGSELEFICRIDQQGKYLFTFDEEMVKCMDNETFELKPLSLTYKTFIAFSCGVFVVKIKSDFTPK
jgi:hypothetical protein